MSAISRLSKVQSVLMHHSSGLFTELNAMKNPVGPPMLVVDRARSLCGLLLDALQTESPRIPMILFCPSCGKRHIDEGIWENKQHHTHSCQECGFTWRPAVVNTVGVRFLPGFKNEEP
jgi:predicted RNA-binding Zn-ribbon protein involved in translation (DUF1610 family)